MKNLIQVFILVFLMIGVTSCWENVDDITGSGPKQESAGVEFIIKDAVGVVSGATVTVYASKANYIGGAAALATGTTDSEGKVTFEADELGDEAGSFYVNVHSASYSLANWDGTIKTPTLIFTTGKSPVVLTLKAPVYSEELTGDDEVVSGSTHTYSVADYPGTYTWYSSSPNVTFDAGTTSAKATIAQNTESDETYTISVDIVTGSEDYTLSMEVTASQFCTYVPESWDGLVISGTDRNASPKAWGTNGEAIIVDGNDVTFPANGDGTPYLMSALFIGWGETFDEGEGQEGTAYATFSDAGGVTFPEQYLGTTLDGTYGYWVRGSGTFDQCTQTVTISSFYMSYYDDYSAGTTRASATLGSFTLSVAD